MLFEDLATELVAHIFSSCDSIADVTNLSSTCRRFHNVFVSSRRLPILASAADAEYGPLEDVFQLVTQNASQPPHIMRFVPLSDALLKQAVSVGRVAKQWEDLYPLKRWKEAPEDRRLLSTTESRTFRRALYRLWLYSAAFHNAAHPRYSRLQPLVLRERAELLHNWTNEELAEIEDVRQIIREMLRHKICPSNGTIQRKFRKRHPGANHQLCFNVHLNYPPPLTTAMPDIYQYRQTIQNDKMHKFRSTPTHDPGFEGWGDDIQHYYIVEDMLKLDPAQVLWLRDNAPLKVQVEKYVKGLGEWFDNNGETFGETVEWVLKARGEDIADFRADLKDGITGIAK